MGSLMGRVTCRADGVNRESQVNQARCAAGMGAGGERESSVLSACSWCHAQGGTWDLFS